MLSDLDISVALKHEQIAINPYDPKMLQPSSIDIRLDRGFRIFDNHRHAFIDPAAEQPDLTRAIEITSGPFILHPGEFVLASSYEKIALGAAHAARLEGKSSLGRLGLVTHSTAGFIDPGFSGHLTLELSNVASAKSCSGADGLYPRANAKSHGGFREIAVAKGSRRSLLKL